MVQKLIETEQGMALLISPELKAQLGIDIEVDVSVESGRAVIRKPMSIEDVSRQSDEKYAQAYVELAK